jgi:hypothetical protein
MKRQQAVNAIIGSQIACGSMLEAKQIKSIGIDQTGGRKIAG